MSNQTEDLLRAGMERFTAGIDTPSGLAVKAARHHKRRRVANRAMAAAAVATAAGVAVALVLATPPAPAPAATTGVQTAAYVVNRAEAALAQADSQNLVQYLHQAVSGNDVLDRHLGSTSSLDQWAYGGLSRFIQYDSSGRPANEEGVAPHGSQETLTAVDHRNRTWWRWTIPGPHINWGSSCERATALEGPGAPDIDWATQLRAALRCGQFTIAGTRRIDGVRALELKPAHEQNGWTVTLWVDPASYLPVRQFISLRAGTIQNDFLWLQPTQANLTDLKVTVPPGYTQVHHPFWNSGR